MVAHGFVRSHGVAHQQYAFVELYAFGSRSVEARNPIGGIGRRNLMICGHCFHFAHGYQVASVGFGDIDGISRRSLGLTPFLDVE